MRIIGCGRVHREDDQAGLLIAERLARRGIPGAHIETTQAPGADLLAALEDAELLVVIDATPACDALPAGRWARIVYAGDAPPAASGEPRGVVAHGERNRLDAHGLSVNDALELGRTLGILPTDVWIYVVAGEAFGYGEATSAALATAIEDVVAAVRRDVETWRSEKVKR